MLDVMAAGAALTGIVALASGGTVASPQALPSRPSEVTAIGSAAAPAPIKLSLVAAVSEARQSLEAGSIQTGSVQAEPPQAQPAPPADAHQNADADNHQNPNNNHPQPAALRRPGLVVHRSGVVHSSSFGRRSGASSFGGQRVIMIIRHGEKPGKGGGHGLTSAGWARAQGLATVFSGGRGFAAPRTIFAAGATGKGRGQRTRETVAPLSRRLGVPVNASYGKGQEAAVARAAAARSVNGPVLISWQHGEIPAIAKALKVVGGTPKGWGKKDFDGVWKFTWTPRGWVFSSGSEGLGGGGKHAGKHGHKH